MVTIVLTLLCGTAACSGSASPDDDRGARETPAASSEPSPSSPPTDTPHPVRPVPSTQPEPPVERPPVTRVAVVGDIMLGRRVPDPLSAFDAFARRLARADLTLGNLESTLSTDGVPQQGGDSFAASPRVVRALSRAGFDAVSLANNHTGDYGPRALLETVDRLRRGPVRGFGAGANLAEASRPYVHRVNGISFGVLGFNSIGETPRATPDSAGALSLRMPPRTGPLNAGDLRHVLRQVRRLDRRVDVVIVLPHWGTQYTHVAEPSQRQVARRLVDAGADLVVGGHPHWVQGLERRGAAVIAHSLGNFVFDMDFMTKTMEGVVLEATFRGSSLGRVSLVPYVMDERFVPRPVRGPDARRILGDIRRNSYPPGG